MIQPFHQIIIQLREEMQSDKEYTQHRNKSFTPGRAYTVLAIDMEHNKGFVADDQGYFIHADLSHFKVVQMLTGLNQMPIESRLAKIENKLATILPEEVHIDSNYPNNETKKVDNNSVFDNNKKKGAKDGKK